MSSTGNMTLTSAGFSLAASADATIESTANLILSATTEVKVDSAGSVKIGTDGTTSLIIGSETCATTIGGDLIVNGKSTFIEKESLAVDDNLIVLNTVPSGTNIDAGILIQESPNDIVANGTPAASYTSGEQEAANTNQLKLSNTDVTSEVGKIIKITQGLYAGISLMIKEISGSVATFTTNWPEFTLEGDINTAEVNSGGFFGVLVIVGSDLDGSIFSEGCSILVVDTDGNEHLLKVISIVIGYNNIAMHVEPSSVFTIDVTKDIKVVSPGNSLSYEVYNNFMAAMYWDVQDQAMTFASVTADPGYGSITPGDLLNIKVKGAIVENFSIDGTDPAVYDSVNDKFESGALILKGGLGTTSNIVAIADTSVVDAPVLQLNQTSTDNTAKSVVSLSQGYTQGAFLEFTGSSSTENGVTVPGYSFLGVDNEEVTATLGGYVRVKINDLNTGDGNLGNDYYYIPIFRAESN